MIALMPLTAVHPDAGMLDATAPVLGSGVRWEQVHRARPRVPLRCRECAHGVHAKVSPTGLRFFAHDVDAPRCSLSAESLAHHLLKAELVSALRQAGWHGELEVAGDGWRADVLGTSPDRARRTAYEAQLSAATSAELQRRTGRMTASGLEVCWVAEKDVPWTGRVPSVRIAWPPAQEQHARPDAVPAGLEDGGARGGPDPRPGPLLPDPSSGSRPGLVVVDGVGRFAALWCSPRESCSTAGRDGLGADLGPCPGHGGWQRPDPVPLVSFVAGVCAGSIRPVTARVEPLQPLGRHRPGAWVWTTHRHYAAETEQVTAQDARERWLVPRREAQRRLEQDQATRHRHIERLLARQQALTGPAVDLLKREHPGRVTVGTRRSYWAMGLPVLVDRRERAVLSPVAGRVPAVRTLLAKVTVIVASTEEQQRLAKVCAPDQRIVVLEVEVPAPKPLGGRGATITASQAISIMLGERR
jgi:competence protein CoiA